MLLRVLVAPLVSVKVIQGKRRAKRAVPGRLALGVKSARRVLPGEETTTMRRNVNNVNWVKQQRFKEVPLNVIFVILGSLAKPKVSVQHAQTDFIRSPKVKSNVFNVNWENRTSMPKQHALVVTLVGLATSKAIAKIARLDSIKILKQKNCAAILATRLEKYPTKKVPGVNCHRGVPATWVNI